MTETIDKLQSLIESVIRRIDANQKTADERHQAQVAYNDQVSNELKHLAKQIALTQADVDEARKSPTPPDPTAAANPGAASSSGGLTTSGSSTHAPPPPPVTTRPPPPPPPLYTEGAAQLPFARLVNHGPPLLLQNSPMAYEQDHGAEHYTKPPKHDFPLFDGDAPRIWLERCTSYFELYRVPPHNWVTTAALYMDGLAATWL